MKKILYALILTGLTAATLTAGGCGANAAKGNGRESQPVKNEKIDETIPNYDDFLPGHDGLNENGCPDSKDCPDKTDCPDGKDCPNDKDCPDGKDCPEDYHWGGRKFPSERRRPHGGRIELPRPPKKNFREKLH